MGKKLQRLGYEAKYTLGSYVDGIMSIPIFTGEKIAHGIEKVLGENTPKCLTREYTREHSLLYQTRQKLRDSLETRPGSIYLGNNLLSAIPFFGAGIPTAEFAQSGIEYFIEKSPELVQSGVNSLITLAAQIVTGYSAFMGIEVFSNRHKYVDEGNRISGSKVKDCLKNTIKTFLPFDLSYIATKMVGQSWLLLEGKDPWVATSLFDSMAIPTFTALAVVLGLRGGIIDTKRIKEFRKK